jgi:hypothetical protein
MFDKVQQLNKVIHMILSIHQMMIDSIELLYYHSQLNINNHQQNEYLEQDVNDVVFDEEEYWNEYHIKRFFHH